MKSSLYRLIPFLAFILRLLIPKTRLRSIPLLPSSFTGRLASRNLSLHLTATATLLGLQVKVKVTLRLTVSQLVLVSSPIWGSWPDTLWQLWPCFCGAPSLTRGWACLTYMLLALAAPSFSGPSPLGLATVFYCLIMEILLFVASYDSQGHGGGIRPRLHRGRVLFFCNPSARTTKKTQSLCC
jgi:hypothetical protein